MAKREFKYSDFLSTFIAHPTTGDVAAIYDEVAVGRSIRNLIETKKYDRLHQPYLASGIHSLLFELVGNATASLLESRIKDVITNYEPRADLIDVTVTPDVNNNRYDITITYRINTSLRELTVDFFLKRIV